MGSSPLTETRGATQLRGMKLAFYQFLHVASMVLLVAVVFQGFANPDPKTRKRTLRNAGILALTMLIGGFGLVAVMKVGFPWWVIVKTVCWLGIASISGFGYRNTERIPVLTAITVALVVLFHKELLVSSFDTILSASLGINPTAVHYALMGWLSIVVVSAFESVGAILVIAMLILPGATASLITRRLPLVQALSVVHAALSSILGIHLGI